MDFFPDNLEYSFRLVSDADFRREGGRRHSPPWTVLRQPFRRRRPEDARIDLGRSGRLRRIPSGISRGNTRQRPPLYGKGDAQGARACSRLTRGPRSAPRSAIWESRKSPSLGAKKPDRFWRSAGDRSAAARALNTLGGRSTWSRATSSRRRRPTRNRSQPPARSGTGDQRPWCSTISPACFVSQVNLAGSRKMLEEALASFREIDDKGGVARSLDNIGIVLLDEGKPEAARRSILAIPRHLPRDRQQESDGLRTLSPGRSPSSCRAILKAAGRRHTEALALRKRISDQRGIADSELATGQLVHREAGKIYKQRNPPRA